MNLYVTFEVGDLEEDADVTLVAKCMEKLLKEEMPYVSINVLEVDREDA